MEPNVLRKLTFFLAFLVNLTFAFNLDTRFPLIFTSPGYGNSLFGYSVALLENDEGKWLLVGAPRANSSDPSRSSIVEPGAVYKCSIDKQSQCLEIPFHLASKDAPPPYNYMEMPENGWLGGSLDVANVLHDPFILTCAHLWKNKFNPENYLANGMCIVANSNLGRRNFMRLTPLTIQTEQTEKNENGEDIYKYGFGLAGFSSQFLPNSNDILLGAPGVGDWKGTIVHADESGYRKSRDSQKFQIPKPTDKILPNSYFGYSVTSGSFFDSFNVQLVAGAPRDGPAGKVYIFDTPTIHDIGFIIKAHKEGHQMGEYFGGAVCAVDVNNDRLDDLLVGAPYHSVVRDEGKVYVYINHQESHALTPFEPLTGSSVVGALFGSAIAALGDLNQDGFNDVGVGAPYENDVGAVYIYHGSSLGLKLVQTILASDVNPLLSGFGISISRGADMDNNRYIDVAIGAYESNKAVLLRSHPVINMKADIRFDIDQINMNHVNCSLNNVPTFCFLAKVCTSYSSKNGPNSLDIENIFMLGESDHKETRAFIKFSQDSVTETKYSQKLIRGNNACRDFQVHVLNSTVDILTPLKFSVTSRVENDPFTSTTFCKNCPVTSDDSPAFTRLLPFATFCGKDDVCLSDVSVTAKVRGQKDNTAFVIGSFDSIALFVETKNAGEPAYQSKAIIYLPKEVTVLKKPDYCKASSSALVCDVGNPLRQNRMVGFDVILDVSHIPTSTAALHFEVQINTTSKNVNKDNSVVVVLPLESDADMILIGATEDEQILLNEEKNSTKHAKKIIHEFKVLKKGYTPVKSVFLTITVPAILPGHAEPFLHMNQIIPVFNRGVIGKCNYYNYTDEIVKTHHENVDFGNAANFVLQCSGNNCHVVECELGPFFDQENAAISLEFEVNMELLKTLLREHDFINLVSKGSLSIKDSGLNQPSNHFPDFAQVTTQFVKSGPPAAKQIEDWIIVVCVIVGILLLLIIIAVLAKIGFFHRKEKEEMVKLAAEDDNLLDNESEKQILPQQTA